MAKEMTRDEWLAEGKRLYGDVVEKWRVRCPMCGRVSEVSEFKAAGASGPDCAFKECIGRYTGKGTPRKEPDGKGCNWAAYGLLGIPRDDKYIITFEDGAKMEAFPFADKED